MGPATTTTANLSQQIMTYYNKQMLVRLMNELHFAQLGVKKPLPSNSGKSMVFNRYTNFSAATTALTDGTIPAAQTLASSNLTATVSQYGAWVSISDLIQVEAISDVVVNCVDVLKYQAALTIDTIIRNAINSNGTITYANGRANQNALTSTDVFNGSEVRKIVNNLQRNSVLPLDGQEYAAIIHPQTKYDLESDTATGGWLVSNQYMDAQKIFNGEVGKMYGVRFLMSQNAYTVQNGSSVNCYYNYFFGKEPFGIVDLEQQNLQVMVHRAGTSGAADPLDQINSVGWKVSFAAIVLQALACYIDESGSSQ